MAKELYFVRHGQTQWNVQGRLQGRGDSPLTALGETQAAAHQRWLREVRPGAVIASPLGRVRATVALATRGLERMELLIDDSLSERCMGEFEGWTMAQIAAEHPRLARAKDADPWTWQPPGGEDYNALMARTAPLVERLRHHPHARVLVVSHGTIVRPILAQLLGLNRATTLRVSSPNDLVYRVSLSAAGGERWTIAHLDGERWAAGLRLLPARRTA